MRVLIASGFGGDGFQRTVEAAVAHALAKRGAAVDVLLCDSTLPACPACRMGAYGSVEEFLAVGPRTAMCDACFGTALEDHQRSNVHVYRLGAWLTSSDHLFAESIASSLNDDEIRGFRLRDLDAGGYAASATLEFFGRVWPDELSDNEPPEVLQVLRRYFIASVLTVLAISAFLDAHDYDVALSHNRAFVPARLMLTACARRSIRIVGWHRTFRAGCVSFEERGFKELFETEPLSTWESLELTPEMDRDLDDYFTLQRHGIGNWRSAFGSASDPSLDEVLGRLDPRLPIVGLFPNVNFSGFRSSSPEDTAFTHMRAWVDATIGLFARRPHLQLVIRLHPHSEALWKEAERLIAESWPVLPPNVLVVSGGSQVNTYGLGEHCNAAIVWTSTTAMELSARGIPVIVAGDAWMRRKGFTMDATTPDEYAALLDRLPFSSRLDTATHLRARKYAYHFFFRHMLDVTSFGAATGAEAIERGARPATVAGDAERTLEVVCNGILDNAQFIYPA